MKNVLCSILLFVICFVIFISCEPVVTTPKPAIKTDLNLTILSNKSDIPKEYGTLVSVTTTENWAQLWFVDEEQTIYKVSLGLLDYQLNDTVLVIPRN